MHECEHSSWVCIPRACTEMEKWNKKGVCLLLLYNVSDMHPPNNAMGHQQANTLL